MAFRFVYVQIGAQGWQSALHLVHSEDVLTLEGELPEGYVDDGEEH